MNITRRRGAIAFFITLGALLVGLSVGLSFGWIILNDRAVALAVVGVILFSLLIAGVVLNTVFLVREISRNERQDSFLNAVSHELKTPIASTRLYLETLQRRPVEEEQRQQFYKIMLADSDRLLATVEQVLKAGELGQRHRQQNRTLVEIRPLLADCIQVTLQRYHLDPESIVLDPAPAPAPEGVPLRVLGIAEDLRTAIINVLDNAVKYSPEGVHVRCSLAIAHPSSVTLRIADRGIGLPENQNKRIFRRFYRVPGRPTAKIRGTGLGLFLVRNIVSQHGGHIKASSPGPGLGTTVTFTLPLAAPAASPEHP
jgi:signal transduction histidine kinase